MSTGLLDFLLVLAFPLDALFLFAAAVRPFDVPACDELRFPVLFFNFIRFIGGCEKTSVIMLPKVSVPRLFKDSPKFTPLPTSFKTSAPVCRALFPADTNPRFTSGVTDRMRDLNMPPRP